MSFTTSTTTLTTTPLSSIPHHSLLAPAPLRAFSRAPPRRSSGLGSLASASTPNLNSLYTAHSRLAPPGLSRKASFAALTPNSLASIPDDTESYALHSVLNDEDAPASPTRMLPPISSPARPSTADPHGAVAVGDSVDVPGNMVGTVRFVGSVGGRRGVFAGVELHPEFALRGKNNGDVDGVSYFTTTRAGAGIFLPLSKAVRRGSPLTMPLTPTASMPGLKAGNQNSTNFTPPTPSLPKFSQSIGPSRTASPTGKRPRMSIARPESPIRRLQMTPAPRSSIATPAPKVAGPRYGGSPNSKFSQSVRGTAGDPSKRGGLRQESRVGGVGPRSASALGGGSQSGFTDDETTPVGLKMPQTNGSIGSISSLSAKLRPPSRTANGNASQNEEMERLRAKLEDRDRQLKEQAQSLAEMESNLTELQTLFEAHVEGGDVPMPGRRGSLDDKDTAQLRALLREKNEKIAMLTAEFDAHRADFRSTIDTLELASTETERVYEKKLEEVLQELHDYQDRTTDVNAVAKQLKQLEELVQELEEGLEDARRGEAEARGEVEFLRGEVERTRSELRREREKAASAGPANGTRGGSSSKELEQKEDEIRGLKAIIHSLSRDSIPGLPGDDPNRTPTLSQAPFKGASNDRIARERLEREVAELRALLNTKSGREGDIERELDQLRIDSHRASAATVVPIDHDSFRDSRGTAILSREVEPRSPEGPRKTHTRATTLDTMPESDAYSTATENSTLWCELCETSGHGILNCTNMFGPQGNGNANGSPASARGYHGRAGSGADGAMRNGKDVVRNSGVRNLSPKRGQDASATPAPLSPMRTKAPVPTPDVKILPNPMESGPVAGKESGVVDVEKWCALCERDGHDSVDCPFEDAF
ncbi:hypothetical protein GGTG_03684 [Gaeumannomyces tritici R3-111a-1]|uniref:CAP-Gly domain-containing protein n=1 Tax=Gaeumannomyces tritici (strain R3-111a-1) TaxID=644352 RepID=J3NQX9_GAET3|nr:hypothetical protein GGTG_03684 [Gaeumannomyces tritici R3-111a-1]EJT78585.1 hypothetical protein GGTG_03684 [Gaeumannomyces tritici R3-111a-1]